MKFELTDFRQQKISDLDIINDLRTVANNLGKKSLKITEYCKDNEAKYSIPTLRKRFGNWKAVLEKAGLEPENSIHGIVHGETSIKEELILEDIVRVANELNNPRIKLADYEKIGKYGGTTIQRRFGGWIKATKKAGLDVGRIFNTTTEELLQNILELWTLLGRQPRYAEVLKPNSKYSISLYEYKFGTWGAALEEFVNYMNSEDKELIEAPLEIKPLNDIITPKQELRKEVKTKRTPRSINLRLRWAVLKRDNFSCNKCGRSPAKDPSIVLHVDHIIPWSKEGETVIENLETLCEQCNLGKSNLL